MNSKKQQKQKIKKGKFHEINESFFKADSKEMSKNTIVEYETPLQYLMKLFPEIDQDIVENIYENNFRNISTSKATLTSLFSEKPINEESVKKEENQIQIQPVLKEINKPEILLNVKYDLTNNLEEEEDSINNYYLENFEKDGNIQDIYIEEFLVEENIELIKEVMPFLNFSEIEEKLYQFNFDINKIILDYLSNGKLNSVKEYENSDLSIEFLRDYKENLEKLNIKKEFIDVALDKYNFQKDIELFIKKKNIIDKTTKPKFIVNEKNFPSLSKEEDNNKQEFDEQDLLTKDLNSFKNKKIRSDILELKKVFPLEDEFSIRWVYYQYMDLAMCKQILNKKRILEEYFSEKPKVNIVNNQKPVAPSLSMKTEIQNDGFSDTLYSILSKKPIDWNLQNMKNENINFEFYHNVKTILLRQAKLAWSYGKYQESKIIIAKLNKYRDDFTTLLQRHKLNIFSQNNENHIPSLYETNIDLHSLNFDESKILVCKKIQDLKQKIKNGIISRHRLMLITGKGIHSKEGKPILLPRLSNYLKEIGIKFKANKDEGLIKIYL